MKQPELGRKIAEFRNECGLTQEQLAEKSNINIRTLQRIESGEVMPRSFTLKIILEILGKDYSEVNGTAGIQISINSLILKRALNAGIILMICNALYLSIVFLRDLYGVRSGIYHLNSPILLAMFVSTIFFNLGFIHIGKSINNPFLVITGIAGIILTFFCDILYMATFYNSSTTLAFLAKAALIINSINGIFYGVGLLLLKKYLDELAILSGVAVITVSVLLILPVGIVEVVALVLSTLSMLIQTFVLARFTQKRQGEVSLA